MAYIGPEPNPGQNREVDDISSGFNGSEVNFTLQVNSQNVSPGSSNNIIVSLGGVVQNPSTDYTVAASTLTFTTAPASGLSFFGLVLGQQVDIQSLADGTSPTMSAPSITGDLSIADKIVHTGDTNTAIRFPAADTVTAETGGSERVRLDSSGNLALGGFTPPADLNSAIMPSLFIDSNQNSISAESGALYFTQNAYFNSGGSYEYVAAAAASQYRQVSGAHIFATATSGSAGANFTFSERARISSDGNCGIGTSSPSAKLHVSGGDGLLVERSSGTSIAGFKHSGASAMNIYFQNTGSTNHPSIGSSNQDFTIGTNNTERMRVASGGAVTFNATGDVGSNNPGVRIQNPDVGTCRFAVSATGADTHIQFLNNNANNVRGSIVTDGSSTAYNTSSDYRLKENQTAISDGITRIKLLNPYRFNWKEDSSTIVDGFFAHEVSSIVPEAITGEKDAVAVQADVDKGVSDKVGDPIYQQIDQSKLVPLLTAALQEAITKIETLETKVAALEAA